MPFMRGLRITGGNRLSGTIAAHGAKNAVLPILAATVLCSRSEIKNCPNLSDVAVSCHILRHLGFAVERARDTLIITREDTGCRDVPSEWMRAMRSSILFLGGMLARCGSVTLCPPGGCALGGRPIDLHLSALRQMGAVISEEGDTLRCAAPGGLHGAAVQLPYPSVGATENLLIAAVLCGVGFYCVSVFCRATHIEVTGSTRYAAEDIIEAADIGEEQNIFTISQKALNERITALCPYIECVTLHRRLPDTLELELHEFNTIYACIGSMGRVTTLSADGKVLEQCASLPEYTCLLLGADFSGYTAGEKLPEEWQKTLAGVDKVRAALEDAGMFPEIGYIEIGEEQSYKAVYQDRIQLRLGSEYDLATKLLTAQKIIQDELPADFIGYLDVSVSGRAYTRQLPLTQVADAQYLAILGGKQ